MDRAWTIYVDPEDDDRAVRQPSPQEAKRFRFEAIEVVPADRFRDAEAENERLREAMQRAAGMTEDQGVIGCLRRALHRALPQASEIRPRRTPMAEKFYVVTEEGDSMGVDAQDAHEAANQAVLEWGLEAEPGYRFYVFAKADAQQFKIGQTVVHASAD